MSHPLDDTQGKIEQVAGTAIVIRGDDIDTDRIIPARYLKMITFEGIGKYAFYDERFDQDGNERPHPFNDSRFKGASIMLVGQNFGCGSSREHAPQTLMRSGIKLLIGESFAEIFAGNCTALGMVTVTVSPELIKKWSDAVEKNPSQEFRINLKESTIEAEGESYPCNIANSSRHLLVSGTWDTTSTLLSHVDEVHTIAARIPYIQGFVSQ